MKLYHRTPAAKSILKSGFTDSEGTFLTSEVLSGVWFSDRPLDSNEGAKGYDLLLIELPGSVAANYEWEEEGKPYREFMIPAEVVNQYGKPRLVEDEEE